MLHPATCLVLWFALTLSVQWVSGLILLALCSLMLFVGRPALQRWISLLRRARWLLLTLWIVLAYSIPGVLLFGFSWAPTQEGAIAASEQFLRLVLTLGALAVLLAYLSRQQLMLGLWTLTSFFLPRAWVDKSVARLILVMEYVERAPQRGNWKALLTEPVSASGGEHIVLATQAWRGIDLAIMVCVPVLAILVGVLL